MASVTVHNFINGKFIAPKQYLDSYDPSTGEVWAKIPDSDTAEVETAIEAASKAFERYVWVCVCVYSCACMYTCILKTIYKISII